MSDPVTTHPAGEGSTLLFLVYLEIWYLASDAMGIRGHLWSGLKFFMHINVEIPLAATLMLGWKAGALFTCTPELISRAKMTRSGLRGLVTSHVTNYFIYFMLD